MILITIITSSTVPCFRCFMILAKMVVDICNRQREGGCKQTRKPRLATITLLSASLIMRTRSRRQSMVAGEHYGSRYNTHYTSPRTWICTSGHSERIAVRASSTSLPLTSGQLKSQFLFITKPHFHISWRLHYYLNVEKKNGLSIVYRVLHVSCAK